MNWIRIFSIVVVLAGGVSFAVGMLPADEQILSGRSPVAGNTHIVLDEFRTAIANTDPHVVYGAFTRAYAQTSNGPRHAAAHLFGEALYRERGLDGLGVCDQTFEFGCYHGFLGIAIAQEGVEVLPELDQACQKRWDDAYLPCQHGIGHGVLTYVGTENLIEALELCTTISWQPTGGCSSGVFMEYNFRTMEDPARGVLRPLGENPYAPCDTLPAKHRPSCYFEQVQWWTSVYDRDFTRIGSLCAQIDSAKLRATCFEGAGNYAAAFTDHAVPETIAVCQKMPNAEGRQQCFEGASWIFSARESLTTAERAPLCDKLVGAAKERCYE